MDNIFYELSKKWKKFASDKGGLKSLGFSKLVIHAGEKHVVINEDRILPLHLGTWEVVIRVIGAPPSMLYKIRMGNQITISCPALQGRNLPGLLHISPKLLEGS